MLGQSTAISLAPPARWFRMVWGVADIHTRQKWNIVWPHLSTLPHEGIRLLDAGCGTGQWTLEIAARRPHWGIVGLDKDQNSLAIAERERARLRLENVTFEKVNLLEVAADAEYDVVLSVESSHYLAESGQGAELFEKYAHLLRRGGDLVVVASRCREKVPVWPWLPKPPLHDVFSEAMIIHCCKTARLTVETLDAQLGLFAVAAKQISVAASSSMTARVISYPLQLLLNLIDGFPFINKATTSCSWFLHARR